MAQAHALSLSRADSPTGLPTARVGIWWFLASEIAIFGGAVACYVLQRFAHPQWGAEAAHTWTAVGAVNTVVLLTSSLAAALADHAAEEGNGKRAASLLSAAALGGLVFLGLKAVEYTREIEHGFTPIKGLFWSFYYLMTGLHALHVLVGMIALLVVAKSAAAGKHMVRVPIAAIYWHFVDVVWIFLFPLLYLAS